jgi:magnesium transporter
LGLLIGGTVGAAAGLGVFFFGGHRQLALVISITLLATSFVATLVATLLPLALDRLGVDPALASGPIATVLQDLLSVAMYLGIASALL